MTCKVYKLESAKLLENRCSLKFFKKNKTKNESRDMKIDETVTIIKNSLKTISNDR